MIAIEDFDDTSVTRIYVTGLPPSTTNDQVRSHFAAKGKYTVTDAHVIPDRRIAFVGFSSHEDAQNAVHYFNKSFVRMSKISVTLARPVQVKRDEKGLAVPVSERSSRKRKRHVRDDGEHVRGEADNQPQQVTSRPSPQANDKPQIIPEEKENLLQEQQPEEMDEDAETPAGPRSDLDWLRGKTNRTLDLMNEHEVQKGRANAVDANVQRTEDMSTTFAHTQPAQDVADGENEEVPQSPQTPSVSVPNARLFIRNLPFDTRENDLRAIFTPHGRISEIHLVNDTKKSTGKGLAYIQFVEPTDAANALVALDGRDFQGRLLHILPSTDKRTQKLSDFEISKLPLKQQRAIKRKNEASTSTFSWNSLYMNPDAVLASVADRLGVSKAELLDPASADAAVKQAHAETSVIKETKDYLKSNGVNVDAFKSRSRDDRTLLLKNFSFGTTSEELSQMLGQYGTVERLLFPPTGTMAVVQYHGSSEANLALKQLAYRNLRGSVLFLEKAPAGLWDGPASAPTVQSTKAGANEADGAVGTTFTIFVRNLNFATTSARLLEAFKPLSGFLSARVKTRTDPNRPGEILSMGFGFVEVRTKSQADAAIAAMNGRRLDGHELLVQASQKSTDLGEERRKEDTSKKLNSAKTKVVIKNLPFEATKKDVRALFSAYGQLRTVRLPKKFDNTARGFAFAEFLTAKEAENAIEALSNTHLLGRRLVLDFAEGEIVDPEAEIRAMEKKVQGHQDTLTHHRMTGSVRKKFNVDAREDFDPL
ncbi:Multiple RNA-binding domain-containing protein 1 [Cladophialophora chaetospira]|uniref:Multiple RNA-binding domain-containing protein 1 n=1 Tax=Cladophialophora chaetospira TaxID=386627 RepID=A0AA38XPR2_9EURO|nr:Multiple RNA-binding domain-containing protein 1 [Cladophialophora chaetospira]